MIIIIIYLWRITGCTIILLFQLFLVAEIYAVFRSECDEADRLCWGGYDPSTGTSLMRRAINFVSTGKYNLLGINGEKNNCQYWANRVKKNYEKLINNPVIQKECKLWFFYSY